MPEIMDQCINPDVSLAELYHNQSRLKHQLKIGKLLNREKSELATLKKSLKEVNDKIKVVEDVGFNGNGIIRIM
jgi:hypothetical protein